MKLLFRCSIRKTLVRGRRPRLQLQSSKLRKPGGRTHVPPLPEIALQVVQELHARIFTGARNKFRQGAPLVPPVRDWLP
jgi:hypothetical protein